jgi:hypothetical protein
MLSHGSTQQLRQQGRPHTHKVTVSVRVSNDAPTLVTHYTLSDPESACEGLHTHPITCTAMASKMELLECPMCDFTIPSKDHGDYVLQLHFEQVHTTDSPFVIEDDPEPLPPSIPLSPSSKRKLAVDTPSDDSDEEESTVVCPEPNCGEVVSLADFNDHLDYHTAESLSFDETTGKYHSHHPSATMQSSTGTRRGSSKNSSAAEGHSRKTKKHTRSEGRHASSSEKSTIGRSILTFNPFAKPDKSVKPPLKSARLGVSTVYVMARSWTDIARNPSSALTPGRIACLSGCTISSKPAPRSLPSTALVETAVFSSMIKSRTRRLVSSLFSLSYPL